MKRKVIKQGNGTLTITLPKKWTEEMGLTRDSEVEVEADRNGLIVRTSRIDTKRSITIDADKFERFSCAKFLIACYEHGFDTITLTFSRSTLKSWLFGEESLSTVVTFYVNRLIGFEILSQTKNRITIGNVSEKHVKFQNIASRIFYLTEECLANLIEAFESNDYSQIEDWQTGHESITKLITLATRILYESESCSKTELTNLITILCLIDKTADFIKYSCRYTILNNEKVSRNTIELARKALAYVEMYRSLFNKFDYSMINSLNNLRGDIKQLYLQCIKKNPKESAIAANFEFIVEMFSGAVKPRIAMHLEKTSEEY